MLSINEFMDELRAAERVKKQAAGGERKEEITDHAKLSEDAFKAVLSSKYGVRGRGLS